MQILDCKILLKLQICSLGARRNTVGEVIPIELTSRYLQVVMLSEVRFVR